MSLIFSINVTQNQKYLMKDLENLYTHSVYLLLLISIFKTPPKCEIHVLGEKSNF